MGINQTDKQSTTHRYQMHVCIGQIAMRIVCGFSCNRLIHWRDMMIWLIDSIRTHSWIICYAFTSEHTYESTWPPLVWYWYPWNLSTRNSLPRTAHTHTRTQCVIVRQIAFDGCLFTFVVFFVSPVEFFICLNAIPINPLIFSKQAASSVFLHHTNERTNQTKKYRQRKREKCETNKQQI